MFAMPLELPVTLVGNDDDFGEIQFGDFRDFCESLAQCLRKVENIVSDGQKVSYAIADLKKASASITLRPIPPSKGHDPGTRIIGLFVDTVARLENGDPVDPRLSSDDLKVFRRLAEPVNRRLKEVRIGGTKVTTQFLANVDKIVGIAIPSEGFVKGRLERLNLHNCNEFIIYPPITGFSVVCCFPDELYPIVHEAIRKTVTVFGLLYFRPDRAFPENVLVKTIEVNPPDEKLPTLASLRGTWKGSTDGLTALDFLKKSRS